MLQFPHGNALHSEVSCPCISMRKPSFFLLRFLHGSAPQSKVRVPCISMRKPSFCDGFLMERHPILGPDFDAFPFGNRPFFFLRRLPHGNAPHSKASFPCIFHEEHFGSPPGAWQEASGSRPGGGTAGICKTRLAESSSKS